MEHLTILANLIVPPTPAVVDAIESGLLALDAQHVSPDTATALMQHLCNQAVSASPFVEAGETIFQRLLELGGNPWDQILLGQPNAATAALQHRWEGPVMIALSCPHPPINSLVVLDGTTIGGAPFSWLRFAVKHGMHDVVRTLLEAGIDPNLSASDEDPLLHTAPTYKGIIPLLLKYGADPCAQDEQGRLCVQVWSRENSAEYVDMLACMLDRGAGLDRISLLLLAGGRPSACRPLLEDVEKPKLLVDDQGHSIFFRMAANALDRRYKGQHTHKQILNYMKEALSWYARDTQSHADPLDEGAAQLLLWSARVMSSHNLANTDEQAIFRVEAAFGLPVCQQKALTSLDAMVDAGLLHDPSEVAATALGGYWKSTGDNPEKSISVMTTMLDPELNYPGLQWLDRCFRGIPGGSWFHGKPENYRWKSPDIPIAAFCNSLMDFAHKASPTHTMWSQPDMGRILVQLLRSHWPNNGYYQMELPPLDATWSSRLEIRHAPLLRKMDQQALREALSDPCCRATVMSMENKNCHIQSLCAELAYETINVATPSARARAKLGQRL